MKKKYRYGSSLQYLLLILSVLVFITSFLLQSYFINKTSLSHQARDYENTLKEQVADFRSTLTDTALLGRLLTATETRDDIRSMHSKPYYFFLYKDGPNEDFMRYWNTGQIEPPDSIVLDDNTKERFSKLSNGYYYILKQSLQQDSTIRAYCLIRIKTEYFIPTEYLVETFPHNPGLDHVVNLSLEPTAYPVKSPGGLTLFYFDHKPNAELPKDSSLSVTLRIVGLFFVFLSIYFILYRRFGRKDPVSDIYTFVACMLAYRLVLYVFAGPFNLRAFELFDPAIYGSSIFLPNLGDLLINSLLFCGISVFIWNRTSSLSIGSHRFLKGSVKWILGFLSLIVLVFCTFTIIDIILNLITDSKISFDVTNFFSLSIYTAVGFVILAALSLGFFYFSRLVYRFTLSVFNDRIYLVYFLIAVVGLLYTSFFGTQHSVVFYIPGIIWLLLYTAFFLNEKRINSAFSLNVTGVIIWIFIFSISISSLMLNQISKKELLQRRHYVEKLATQSDEANIRLISLGNKYLDSNFFASNFHRFYDSEVNRTLRDSISKSNYIGYLNNYSTSFYFFDSIGHPLFNSTQLTLAALNTTVDKQTMPTDIPDLYFYEMGFDKFSYIMRKQVVEHGQVKGTVFIISEPKRFGKAVINPELFRQYGQWEISNSSVYYYAVYKNKLLTSTSQKYPFTTTLLQSEVPKRRYEVRQRDNFNELWYVADSNTVVVMARRSEVLLETITLFSYIFCAFLLLVALVQLLTLAIDFLLGSRFIRKKYLIQPTIRGQIHTTFILITVLSFIVVGIATISFFVNRFQMANNDRLGRIMKIMLNELQTHKDLPNIVYTERLAADSVNHSAELSAIIKKVSDVHGVDVNIYDVSGRLLASSQPDIYTRGVVSSRIGPRAYYNLLRLRSIEHIQNERISALSFTSIYAPVRDDSGAFYAYLSIPYFTSQNQLNQEISSFLVTLINLNAFIFLVTGMVALLITNRITRSFNLISEKMNEVSLSKNNEQIAWEKDDEIGSLVKEYNRMVVKLQRSADELAMSERHGAWQEMAMQVAHEIKNPLTPMKLSLQYLQRAIDEGRPNIEDLASNVSKTLVEQIDHLAKIAADFSQFANIGTADTKKLSLHEIIAPLQRLYATQDDVTFKWHQLPHDVFIQADKTQVNRLLTNLITNSIDASRDNTKTIITVHEKLKGGFVIVGVQDNGTGIKDEMRNKIFAPNFTTKTSGTGLGLAMSKVIVEQMGGAIWFETQVGVGSTFYVKIPLAGA